MQTFQYPNIVAGTDAWSDWWEPAVGAENETFYIASVEFPRAIESDDVVCAGVEMEFDGLDLTASGAKIAEQGDVEQSWHYSNVVVRAVYLGWPHSLPSYGAVLEGTHLISGVNVVSSGDYDTAWNMSPVGKTTFRFGFRIDNCGGGTPPRAASHGHAQRGRRPARVGTGRGGGVAVGEYQ